MSAERIANAERDCVSRQSESRRIFFPDIGNYAGRAVLGPDDVAAVRESVERQFAPGERDLVVVGTSHDRDFMTAALAWEGPRHVLRRGHDGRADLALLEAIGEYRLDTFGEVLLMSGDGIFADAAAELVERGLDVTVVSRPGSLGWRLVAAAPFLLAA